MKKVTHKAPTKAKHVTHELQKTALQYLQHADRVFFEQFQSLLNEYATIIANNLNFLPPLIILSHEIDLIKLFDFSITLYEKCIYFPALCQRVFQEAVDNEIKQRSCLIQCKLLLQSTIFSLIPHGNCSAAKNGALCQFKRYLLTAMTVPVIQNHATLYRCVNNTCVGYDGRYFPTTNDSNCRHKVCFACGNAMIEELKGRKQIQEISVILISSEGLKAENGVLCEPLKCSVRGPLQKELELGATYHVWGYYTSDTFEVWGLKKEMPFSVQRSIPALSYNNQVILSSLRYMYPNNPWSLPMYLASQLDQNEHFYGHLKMALILSLATVAHNTPASILCLGPDFVAANKLMNLASLIAAKTVEVTSPLSGTVTKSEIDGQIWLHGGVSALSNSGVCVIGDWMNLTATQRKEILSIVEEGKITVSTKNIKLMELAPVSLSLPLKTAFWIFMHHDNCHRQEIPLNNLIDIFGIPIINTSTDIPVHKCVHDVPLCDLSELMAIVNSIDVKLTEEAVQLIKDYFTAARKMRGNKFPLRSVTTLTVLAEGHTRLALRSEVLYDDVVAIIYLYENSLCHLYGHSTSAQPPFTSLSINNINETMTVFKQWLKCYLMTVVN